VSSLSKADLVRESGADEVVDLSRPNLRDSLREQVYAVTGGNGADIILDPLGDDIFDAALRALAWRGRLVVIGFAAGRIPTIKANYLLLKNIEVSGLQVSDYRKRRPEQMAECLTEIFALYEAGKVRPAPTTTLPLARFQEALSQIRDRKARGRVVLTTDE
jgi:NADPH2:quinone reductase